MKSKMYFIVFSVIFPLANFIAWSSMALELKEINFFQEGEVSKLELTFDQNEVQAKNFHVAEDKQIILDLKDVNASDRVLRAFDTSEFSGSVVFVSPYRRPGNDTDLRIALQLRDNVRSIMEKKENKLILSVENRFGVFSQNQINENKTTENALASGKDKDLGKLNVPKSTDVIDILENVTQSGAKKYIGKKISINVKDAEITSLLKMVADASGFNIIMSDDVKKVAPMTLALTNIPWDQALDTILSLAKLVSKKNGNILMVRTYDEAVRERKIEDEEKTVSQNKEPLVTRIFPISFAKIEDLVKLLKDYSTPQRGSISFDDRTNNLIVKDTTEVMERMSKIIETLDTQTPQILIEAKIVEASENFKREMGLQDGMGFGYDPITPSDKLSPTFGPGFSFSSAPAIAAGGGSRSFLTFGVKAFKRLTNLDLKLQLMESESKGKVISSPKIVAQNKKKALLSSSDTTSYKVVNRKGDEREESFQEISADLILEVTPQVTNEGSIAMKVKVSKAGFQARPSADAPPGKQTRVIETDALVDNGSTVVLGGIYTYEKEESHSGVPFLKDLPIIGWLFRTAYNPSKKKNELIIFITPRIINQEEAGLVDRDESLGA